MYILLVLPYCVKPVLLRVLNFAQKCINALEQVSARAVSVLLLWYCVFTVINCNLKGRPIIICDKDDIDLEKKAFHCLKVRTCIVTLCCHKYAYILNYFFQVPKVADCLQGILTVVPLQLLSFHIAVLKGYDVSGNVVLMFAVHSIRELYNYSQYRPL